MSPKAKFPEELCLAPIVENKCNYPQSEDRRCKMVAGWGTPHLGDGRCKKHGGSGRPIVHGKYSKYKDTISTQLADKYEEFLDDPDYLSLKDEVAKARAQLANVEENEGRFGSIEAFVTCADKILNTIAKLAVTADKIEHGEKFQVNVAQMTYIIEGLIKDIDLICEGCPRRRELAEKFANVELITAPAMIEGGTDESSGEAIP